MQDKVLVIHSGARHNYALPAAFADGHMLEAFYTDMCGGKGLGRIASFAARLPLPAKAAALAKRLSSRKPPANVLEKTRTTDRDSLDFELARMRLQDPVAKSEARIENAVKRGKTMQGWGLGKATHVFNVLGEGGELLLDARKRGLPIFADIIIALSTNQIEREEYLAFPDWGPAPADHSSSVNPDFDPVAHLLQTTDVFVCPSQFVADDLVEHWGVAREATRIVPYALSEQWFGIEPKTEPGRLLFVGTADRRKGIHYLAKAAEILRRRGKSYEFVVAGGVHDAVREHPEAQHLTFLGRVSREAIGEEFARADAFVLPSLAEGSATVVYEALAAGLPVVTTHSAGSVVRDGVEGLIVPERDPEALADALENIVENRRLRASFAEAAKTTSRAYNWNAYAEKIRALVRET